MAKIHYSNLGLDYTHVVEIAEVLTDAVKETTGFLMQSENGKDWELRYDYNRSWIKLSDVKTNGRMLSLTVWLIVKDAIKWSNPFTDVSINELREYFCTLFESGIPEDENNTWFWSRTACARQNLFVPNDMYGGVDYQAEAWGDGSDLQQFERWGREGYAVDAGDDLSDEAQEESGGRFFSPMGNIRRSIVPDGISSVRVVALKYNNQVIAFRFKTDRGVFDMRRDVAESHGLGSFKTETFITLQSVNGLLMSGSEQKRKSLIPDVSDCQEDCERLITAVFGR